MILNLTLNLDLTGKDRSERINIAYALHLLGFEDENLAIRAQIDAEIDAERQAKLDADPKRTITAGIWRCRAGRVHEVKPNTTNFFDGLPWIVDDYYTVDDAGYTYPGRISREDLISAV